MNTTLIKQITTTLVVDYKTKKCRLLTRYKKDKLKVSEIPVEITLNIEIPEQPIIKAECTVKLSETKVCSMVLEEL